MLETKPEYSIDGRYSFGLELFQEEHELVSLVVGDGESDHDLDSIGGFLFLSVASTLLESE